MISELEKFKEFVERQKWTFAKTYASKSPHEYIVRENFVGTEEEWFDACSFVREHGFPAKYYSKVFILYYLEGHCYWTMGEPLPQTRVLNRNDVRDYVISITPKKRENTWD